MSIKTKTTLLLLIITVSMISIWLFLKKGEVHWTSENSLVPSKLSITTDSGDLKDLLNSIDQSLTYYKKIDPGTKFSFGEQWCSADDMVNCLSSFKDQLLLHGISEKFFQYINENYTSFQTASEKLLLTGYFEASLSGARQRDDEFKFPVYKKTG